MTKQDKKDYESTNKNIYHFCEREIVDPSDKVVDNNHRGEGAHRGVADRICNVRCVNPPTVVIAIHNSAMYDTHLSIRDVCNVIPGKVTLISETTEEYISFIKHIKNSKIRFNLINVLDSR
ncbi:hypothetical protein QAD02_003501 [Eretmocerus hayati]|uniref:Uncharacterized protein n=1 Tax=Eretmocerus hayati TaxID=131215 RepID=A0ACC2NM95_9HYME|nr:hypothetical protein QAD02_003501 [Eretmocerus hayati]